MSNEESIRDRIEVNRTFQANERTLLEYLRTGLGLLVTGIVIVHLSQGDWFRVMGIIFIPIGIIFGLFGMARFRNMNKHILLVQNQCGVAAKRHKE